MARALDAVGDRWTLLVVRDLLLGPKRYKDLVSGLPGVGTNLLATRLRAMEAAGIVERAVLPPPVGAPAYRLTEQGAGLEPVVRALGRWGGRRLGQRRPGEALVPRAYFVAIRESFRPERAPGLRATFAIRVDGLAFEVRIEGGRCATREGAASMPDATFTMDAETLDALLLEGLTPDRARTTGAVQIEGDAVWLDRFVDLVAIRPR